LRRRLALGAVIGVAVSSGCFPALADPEAPPAPAIPYVRAAQIIEHGRPERLPLRSQVALIEDEREGVPLLAREVDMPRPIASLTKLMTALVVLESGLPLDEAIAITELDRDRLKGTHSRLPVGAVLTRLDLLRAALGASDNRAASALARAATGGREEFIAAMNARAQALGMSNTHYADASGLDRRNVSTARDLARLVAAVRAQPLILAITTAGTLEVHNLAGGRNISFINTNRLVRYDGWEIGLSKTGYTADAGNCLVMQVTVGNRPLTVVLLNSWGKLSKYGDAQRIRDWLLRTERRLPPVIAQSAI
jgi:D-alanyl-D-alanine endopeptidase (penicillin-binding protein 7)